MFFINKEIFRAYDIRGNSLSDITPVIAYRIGFCFAAMNILPTNNKICVGRDGRISSPTLYDFLVKGLASAGADIINIGVVPTPALYFADKQFAPRASIMITASHNPKNDNGFKMIVGGKSFFGAQLQELLKKILETDWSTELKIHSLQDLNIKEIDITTNYISYILKDVHINSKLKIAWDSSNGAACNVVTALHTKLLNNNIVINNIIDGNFPNHPPDPTKEENLQQLQQIIKEHNCDIGIAFDGDADRIVVVTKSGRMLFGDQLLYLFAKDIIKKNPGAHIIVDVKTSQMIIEQIELYGGKPIIYRTGHPFIKAKMQETNALLAGEMSGHIFFSDKYYGYDDGIYAALRLIDLLSRTNESVEEMLAELPNTYGTPEIKIFVPDELKFKVVYKIKQQLINEKVIFDDIDGVRVTTATGWWLVRSSNTEPAIIARVESHSQEGLVALKSALTKLLASCNLSFVNDAVR